MKDDPSPDEGRHPISRRVLLIEDHPANLELMAYLLRVYGYTVLTATDGEEGVEAAKRDPPDLIICDIHLPKMDGYEVVRQLRAERALSAVPRIAVTALAMVGDRDKVLAAGFDGYISKPISPETFVKEIEALAGAHPAAPRAQARNGAADTRPIRSPRGACVLVIDDSPTNRELIRQTLEPFGYEVRLAGSVEEGRSLLRDKPPDLILSDLHMPNYDGFEFIRTVKSEPELRAVPFLFISSSVWGDKDRLKALELGAARFILRPIEPRALLDEIAACLAGTGDGDDPGC